MKLFLTFGLAVAIGLSAFANASYAGPISLPYQTKEQLQSKCKSAGGEFSSDKFGHDCWGKKAQ